MAKSEPWSCIAVIDEDNQDVDIRVVEKDETVLKNDMRYNVASPREWMESIEAQEGSHGAYTVVRCDIKPFQDGSASQICNVWGEGFHLDRLSSSYRTMGSDHEMALASALEQSKLLINSIINDAKQSLVSKSMESIDDEEEEVKVLMITLLWQPIKDSSESILVRGHAFWSNAISIPSQYNPHPITATIAIPKGDSIDFPARHNNMPLAKLSSWCRIRRPLEEKFKTKDVGEVLLARSSQTLENEWELLEGLTSNLFVVYTDGSIRTPSGTVLNGYARHLVLEAAERNGLKVCDEPIHLEDAKNGLWVEAFVTSSIRLVIPVGKVMIPANGEDCEGFKEIWSEAPLLNLPWDTRRWSLLYSDIIKQMS